MPIYENDVSNFFYTYVFGLALYNLLDDLAHFTVVMMMMGFTRANLLRGPILSLCTTYLS